MISSALTLNQKPFLRSQPPSGLEKLDTAPLHELGIENIDETREERSCNNCRRINSVISSEPIQTRRNRSMVINSDRALSCAAVQRRVPTRVGSGKPL